jgi:hypothetical protein
MKLLKQISFIFSVGLLIWSCSSSPLKNSGAQKEEPVVIANDSLEYEVTILDAGFNLYLNSIAQPEGYYDQNYLESKNRIFIINWNLRVQNPGQYDSSIYENIIQYDSQIDYGYEVNYKLFNYFLFAQQKYNMVLGNGNFRRIR